MVTYDVNSIIDEIETTLNEYISSKKFKITNDNMLMEVKIIILREMSKKYNYPDEVITSIIEKMIEIEEMKYMRIVMKPIPNRKRIITFEKV